MPDAPPARLSLLIRLRDHQDRQAWTQFVEVYAPLIYGERQGTGVTSKFGIQGDFEITVGFEIIEEPQPPVVGKFQTRLSRVQAEPQGQGRVGGQKDQVSAVSHGGMGSGGHLQRRKRYSAINSVFWRVLDCKSAVARSNRHVTVLAR
jgi:hypothetical protein